MTKSGNNVKEKVGACRPRPTLSLCARQTSSRPGSFEGHHSLIFQHSECRRACAAERMQALAGMQFNLLGRLRLSFLSVGAELDSTELHLQWAGPVTGACAAQTDQLFCTTKANLWPRVNRICPALSRNPADK